MKRAERLYALVDRLRAARSPISAARLADAFEVSKRTIERDIQSLQHSGVPIYADSGVRGGYSILREYSLPPLALSLSESIAVLAGLSLLASSPYAGAARSARAKIQGVVAEERRGGLEDALTAMKVIDLSAARPSDEALAALSAAVEGQRVVRLRYRSEDGRSETERDVETMGLVRGGDSWMIAGWCRLRAGIRGFHLHRIVEFQILEESAPRRDPALLEADLAQWPTRDLAD